MGKVICEVCGTSYLETANQCPICGCVRSADATTVSTADSINASDSKTYTYVKGGRFSKANVKKRNHAQQVASDSGRPPKEPDSPKPSGSKIDKGLTIAVVVLLLAIIAVVAYILIPIITNS